MQFGSQYFFIILYRVLPTTTPRNPHGGVDRRTAGAKRNVADAFSQFFPGNGLVKNTVSFNTADASDKQGLLAIPTRDFAEA